uniref:Uncharacterized protein n=1 Tax=Timema bartmani TaxID=61472 RepID=A0A7R9HYX4_9NEOP|nr:unnamed protein product [Timema bartmani]
MVLIHAAFYFNFISYILMNLYRAARQLKGFLLMGKYNFNSSDDEEEIDIVNLYMSTVHHWLKFVKLLKYSAQCILPSVRLYYVHFNHSSRKDIYMSLIIYVDHRAPQV